MHYEKEYNTISAVRGIAIFLVVLGHAMIPAIRKENLALQLFWNGIYSFHMFLYFFISGYLFQKGIEKYKQNKKAFIFSKFKLLIIPYITLTIMEYCLLLIGYFETGAKILQTFGLPSWDFLNFAKALFLDYKHYDTHLWFIYTLFFIFLINIAIPKTSGGVKYFVFLILCSGLYPVFAKLMFPIRTIFYWSVPFWVGRKYFSKNYLTKSIDYSGKKIVIFGGLFIILNIVLNILNGLVLKLPFSLGIFRVSAVYEIKHLTGFFGVIIIFWIVSRIKGKIPELLFKLDKYSYDLYIIHQPFLTVGIATIFLKTGINPYVIIPLTTILAIFVSIVLSKYLIRRIKILNIALLGNRSKGN